MSANASANGSDGARVASSPCQEKLDRLGWVMGDVYRVHGVPVEIRTTSAAFARWTEQTLGAHLGRGRPKAQFSAAIGQDATSIHTLYRGIVPLVRSRRLSTIARTLLGELEAFSYPKRRDGIFVFATVVELGETTVLMPSYLAPYLSRSRRLIESKGVRMSAGPAVAVDPRTGALRAAPSRLDVPRGATRRLQAREQPGSEVVEIGRGRHVDVVCWFSREAQEPVRPVTRARALYAIATDTANLRTLGGAALDGLARMIGDAACFELKGDTPRAMLEALVGAACGAPSRELVPA